MFERVSRARGAQAVQAETFVGDFRLLCVGNQTLVDAVNGDSRAGCPWKIRLSNRGCGHDRPSSSGSMPGPLREAVHHGLPFWLGREARAWRYWSLVRKS